MNKRIKEIGELAGLYITVNGKPYPKQLGAEYCDDVYQGFADLIIKDALNEFAKQLYNHGIDESNNPAFYKAFEATERHFGVEE